MLRASRRSCNLCPASFGTKGTDHRAEAGVITNCSARPSVTRGLSNGRRDDPDGVDRLETMVRDTLEEARRADRRFVAYLLEIVLLEVIDPKAE